MSLSRTSEISIRARYGAINNEERLPGVRSDDNNLRARAENVYLPTVHYTPLGVTLPYLNPREPFNPSLTIRAHAAPTDWGP